VPLSAGRILTPAICFPLPLLLLLLLLLLLQSAAKRIRVTGSGKLMARHSGKQHMNEKQTRAQKRELSKSFVLEGADIYRASRCLPYANL
jgi:large subunit ribosomal protein L35